jgi:NAD(P)H-hydrate epimerase
MRAADEYTIETYGLPSFTLMETAGRGSAERIRSAYGPFGDAPVVVLCGKGNNGGDGLVVARRLLITGASVRVVLTASTDTLRDDPSHNMQLLRRLQEQAGPRLTIDTAVSPAALNDALPPPGTAALYVDALLGTGLTSALREPIHSLVEEVNGRPAPVVALDVPTGLHSDTGAVLGTAIQAGTTVTMAAPKVGLLVGEGPSHAGAIHTVDIGIPPFVLAEAAQRPGCVRQTTDAAVQAWWPERPRDAYKYSVGTAVVVGGALRFTGAPRLAAQAAERSGTGYVTCACPDTVQPTIAGALPTVPTRPLPTTEEGIDAPAALDRLADERADAMLVGPGLGRAPGTESFVREVVRTTERPLVLDADGLNACAGHMDDLAAHANGDWILTPHEGEFRRLAGTVDLSDRVRTAQVYAERWSAVLLLKGAPSIVAGPEGTTYVASTGTPALATAGTGDVLAGQCVGLLAQGLPPLAAAASALHLGGAAATCYAQQHDPRSMTASDLVAALPRAIRSRLTTPEEDEA